MWERHTQPQSPEAIVEALQELQDNIVDGPVEKAKLPEEVKAKVRTAIQNALGGIRSEIRPKSK